MNGPSILSRLKLPRSGGPQWYRLRVAPPISGRWAAAWAYVETEKKTAQYQALWADTPADAGEPNGGGDRLPVGDASRPTPTSDRQADVPTSARNTARS